MAKKEKRTDSLVVASGYPCPCCGYYTLKQPPPGSYEICPICFWEDDFPGSAPWSGSNSVSLRQAQRNFLAFGAAEEQWQKEVRSPTAEDYRDEHWQPLDAIAAATRLDLIERVSLAFAEVTLSGGVSIHQARARDEWH